MSRSGKVLIGELLDKVGADNALRQEFQQWFSDLDKARTWVEAGSNNPSLMSLFSRNAEFSDYLLVGSTYGTNVNMYWNSAEGRIEFRSGTTVLAFISSSGFTTVVDSPSDIAGLVYWFAADTEITMDGSNRVSNWGNQGSANDVVQATDSLKPIYTASAINGQAALLFDGTDDVLATSANDTALNALDGLTILTVFQTSTGADVQGARVSKNPTNPTEGIVIRATNDNNISVHQGVWTTGDSNIAVYYNNILVLDTPYYESAVFDGSGSTHANTFLYYLLGVLKSQSQTFGSTLPNNSPSSARPLHIGSYVDTAPNYFKGYIAEVLVYDTALSSQNREAVEVYLANKYGL